MEKMEENEGGREDRRRYGRMLHAGRKELRKQRRKEEEQEGTKEGKEERI